MNLAAMLNPPAVVISLCTVEVQIGVVIPSQLLTLQLDRPGMTPMIETLLLNSLGAMQKILRMRCCASAGN